MAETMIQLVKQGLGAGPWHMARAGQAVALCGATASGDSRNSFLGLDLEQVCKDCVVVAFGIPQLELQHEPPRRLECWRIKAPSEKETVLDPGERIVGAAFVPGAEGSDDHWEILVSVDLPADG